MNDVFQPFIRTFVLLLFDDILVYSKTLEEHKEHLNLLSHTVVEHSLYANAKKCEIGKTTIAYLGHVIMPNGVTGSGNSHLAYPEQLEGLARLP